MLRQVKRMNAGTDVNHGTALDSRAVVGSSLYDGVESSSNGNNSVVSSNQVRRRSEDVAIKSTLQEGVERPYVSLSTSISNGCNISGNLSRCTTMSGPIYKYID